jgi:hypothetical protein
VAALLFDRQRSDNRAGALVLAISTLPDFGPSFVLDDRVGTHPVAAWLQRG